MESNILCLNEKLHRSNSVWVLTREFKNHVVNWTGSKLMTLFNIKQDEWNIPNIDTTSPNISFTLPFFVLCQSLPVLCVIV